MGTIVEILNVDEAKNVLETSLQDLRERHPEQQDPQQQMLSPNVSA